MTKRERLMNALAEIKDTCIKNSDYDEGCGKRCPFLMGKDGDDFRDCEVVQFVRNDVYTPNEWAEGRE